MSIPQRSKLLHSLRQWKTKAIARREHIEAFKKRVEELTHNRDAWKGKAQANHAMVADLQAEVGGLHAEVADLRAEVGEFQSEIADLRATVATLQAENRHVAPPVDGGEKKRSRPLSP